MAGTLLKDTLKLLDDFYWNSFRVHPGRASLYMAVLTEKLEQIVPTIDQQQQAAVMEVLSGIMTAMAGRDFVLVRDLCRYELTPLLQRLEKGMAGR